MDLDFPKKLAFLVNEPALYKIIHGGRYGLKTETVSRALLILTSKRKLRVVCFRELQNSIDESVYQTLKNCVYDLGLDDEFDIQAKTIISLRTGSEFLFKGLRYNIDSIKSLARIDIAWIEEANNVSKTSWDKLEPTIRGKHDDDPSGMGGPFGLGPEIWATFNPELDTDETYIRFVSRKDELYPDYAIDEKTGKKVRYCISVKTSYKDNKWLPVDARLKIQISKANAEKTGNWSDYLHTYEGQTKQVLDGAIYVDEIKKVMLENRRGKVSYNPAKPVFTFWDLGHSNHTSIWFIQHAGVEYNVINFYQNRLQKIPHYLEYLQSLKYNYGCHYLPHDADNETLSANMSIDKQVRLAYPGKVKIVPRVSKKIHAINAVKTIFDLCNFDEINTSEGWQCLCRYAYKVDENGKLSNEPDHNEYSDGADSFATFAQSLKPEREQKKPRTVGSVQVIRMASNNAWMGS